MGREGSALAACVGGERMGRKEGRKKERKKEEKKRNDRKRKKQKQKHNPQTAATPGSASHRALCTSSAGCGVPNDDRMRCDVVCSDELHPSNRGRGGRFSNGVDMETWLGPGGGVKDVYIF